MVGNSFGQLFKITTCGESHGSGIGVIIDGCPAGLTLSAADIQCALDRRRPGQSTITSPRQEKDQVEILSGVFDGKTTGTPMLLWVRNEDHQSDDYDPLQSVYRPSHADYTYAMKYGRRDHRGGGRASARETVARVAAGAVAQKYLRDYYQIEVLSYVEQVGALRTLIDHERVSVDQIDSHAMRCPDTLMADQMIEWVKTVQAQGDSVGGVIKGVIRHVPVGLGEPVFDKLSADLAKAMMSINAVKGFDLGSGFDGVLLLGSEHNDAFVLEQDRVVTATNHAGGILGGLSSGQTIYFRVAFKPVSTIAKPQQTVSTDHVMVNIAIKGRHDACVLPRAVAIVDAMSALVVMDHVLRAKAYAPCD